MLVRGILRDPKPVQLSGPPSSGLSPRSTDTVTISSGPEESSQALAEIGDKTPTTVTAVMIAIDFQFHKFLLILKG
jgi:hypothetical protein